jgi:hypothetical protein
MDVFIICKETGSNPNQITEYLLLFPYQILLGDQIKEGVNAEKFGLRI